MAIKGSLSEASLPDVLQLLAMGRKTGCLSLTHKSNFGYVYFESGRITYASIVNRRDRIGERLVQAGVITREALEAIVAEQNSRGDARIGDLLVERDLVRREELHEFVRVQVEETVYVLYTWNDGTFNFDPGVRAPQQDCVVAISPESLMLEGARRVDEWTLIGKSIKSFDMVFEADRASLARAGLTLPPEQASVLDFVDGKRDVAQIAEASGLTEFDVGKVLHGLLTTAMVRVVERTLEPEPKAVSSAKIDEHRNLGVAFYRAGMADESVREFRRVLELQPDDAKARSYVALLLMRQKKWDEAVDAYRAITALPGADAGAFHNLGLALENLGRYSDALEALHQASERARGRDARIETSLGVLQLLTADAVAADRTFSAAQALWKPKPSAAWYHYAALAAAWLGQLDRAHQLLTEGVSHHSSTAVLHNNLSALLERRGDYDSAMGSARAGIKADDTLPQLHKNAGDLYYRAARRDEARSAFERTVALAPAHGSDVYLKLGTLLLKQSRRDDAIAHWRKALELDPGNTIARNNLSALEGTRS